MGPDGENYYFDAQNWSVSDLMLSFNVTLDEFNSINDTNYQETDTINQTVIKLPNDRVEPIYDEYGNFSYYKRTTEPVVSEVPIIDPHNEVAVVVPPLQAQWAYSNQDQLYEYMWGEAENPTDTYDPQLVESAIRDAKIAWLNRAAEVLFFTEGLRNQISEDSLLLGATNSYGQPTSEEDIINIIDRADAESFSQIFSEYYSVIPEFTEGNDFYEFMMFYDHLRQMEEGGELSSYTSEFDPEYATRTLLESRGWSYGLGPEEIENELIAEELMYMLGESLARRETEGVTFNSDVSTEYLPGLYAMLAAQYGSDYTPDDMVQFVNNLSAVLQNENIPYDARLSLQETQVYSGLYLSGRDMDEDRQLAQAWNTDQQQESQALLDNLRTNVAEIVNLDGEILGVSTAIVKATFSDVLRVSSAYVDYLKNLKNQMPTVEGNLVTIEEATEAEKEGMDAIITMALLLPLGFASETADAGISLLEFLATGDPLAGLGILPILPNQTDEMIGYATDARLLGALDGILPYMDNVSDVARYGYDSADEILESLAFYRQYRHLPTPQMEDLQRIYQTILQGSSNREDRLILAMLRNMRDQPDPLYPGYIPDFVLSENQEAILKLRNIVRNTNPDIILSMERGGVFLADVLSYDAEDIEEILVRISKLDLVDERIPKAVEDIITDGIMSGDQVFTLVDNMMGGRAARVLDKSFYRPILRSNPDVTFNNVWMREAFGFRIDDANIPGNPSASSPYFPNINQEAVNVSVIVGDDLDIIFENADTPIHIFNSEGWVIRIISPDTDEYTRDVLIQLLNEQVSGD